MGSVKKLLAAEDDLLEIGHYIAQDSPVNAERFLYADNRTLQWRPDASLRLDVAEFVQALDRADAAEREHDLDATRAFLEQAASLYQSDLLPSCYDDWIASERERLHLPL